MVFVGPTTEEKRPNRQVKNSMNRSQIFYSDRPDSFADKTLIGNKLSHYKRNNSNIGMTEMPDSFRDQCVSRGRNQFKQMRNKTTIFDPPEGKTLKKIYNRSQINGTGSHVP